MKEVLTHLNTAEYKTPPVKGDVLAITTKKTKPEKILVQVKEVVNNGDGLEIILSRSSFFNWDMFYEGKSWVWRVWNLGQITPTTSVNNFNTLTDY